jgi:hypothetical protein
MGNYIPIPSRFLLFWICFTSFLFHQTAQAARVHKSPAFVGPAPPLHAVYTRTLSLPVIGQQNFTLSILTHDQAHLEISGVLSVQEVIHYNFCPSTGLTFTLPDALRRTLRRFRTKMMSAGYDATHDKPFVLVRPPIGNLKISLSRLAQH